MQKINENKIIKIFIYNKIKFLKYNFYGTDSHKKLIIKLLIF